MRAHTMTRRHEAATFFPEVRAPHFPRLAIEHRQPRFCVALKAARQSASLCPHSANPTVATSNWGRTGKFAKKLGINTRGKQTSQQDKNLAGTYGGNCLRLD
jgi:hypothetical protein